MSWARPLKVLPTLMRVGFAESLAYRAEMIIWVFSTTMPFVMLALWSAVAHAAPVASSSGRTWGTSEFVAYFLTMFMVRQLVSAWAAWEINFEIRQGTLAMRLLKPLHPVWSFATSNLAAMPLRAAVSIPVLVVLFAVGAHRQLSSDARLWPLVPFALLGGWLIAFFANVAIGALAFRMEQSLKVMDVWFTCFFVFSGYLVPTDLFPPWLRAVAQYLPFRYQLGFPVELLLGQHGFDEAVGLLARQWAWALSLMGAALLLWRLGVRRFQAVGG